VSRRAVAVALALALGLGGCGLSRGPAPRSSATTTATGSAAATTTLTSSSSSSSSSSSPTAAAIARARRTHELPTPTGTVHVDGGWRTPSAAVSAFASVYVNWTAATVGSRLRALARASVGQARAEMTIEADEVGRDRELHAGEIANTGAVETVAAIAGDSEVYTVVTRERTSAARDGAYRGLPAVWHVSVATVTRRRDGLWVVSGWQPES
jgi:hypothetical protein